MFSRVVFALGVASAVVLCGCGEHAGTSSAGKRRSGKIGPSPKTQLLRISYCSVGFAVGYRIITLDVRNRRMTSYSEDPRSHKWSERLSVVPVTDLRHLSEAVGTAKLRSFRPRSEWFAPNTAVDTGSAMIVFTWTDRRVAFAVPPEHVRQALRTRAALAYLALDSLEDTLLHLDGTLAPKRQRKALSEDDRTIAAALHRCLAETANGLPQGRKGW